MSPMSASPIKQNEVAGKQPGHEPARPRRVTPVLSVFLAGLALGAVGAFLALWHHPAPENPAIVLSGATQGVLQHLDSPVEIRFYSMLDPSSVPESVRAFAGRVDQILAQYQQMGGDRVRLVRCNSFSAASAKAAEADGIEAFNADKGESCFLGIAVVCDDQRESLPRVAPEWEQAVEPDVTRAISRALARADQRRPGAQAVTRADTAALDAVKKAIPNLDAVTLEAGTQMLRQAALEQFQQATAEMQARVKQAEQSLLQAQGDPSEAAQQAAAEELRKVQAEGTRKLQQIAHDSRAQIAAWEQLKKGAP
jgi:hypothetical protein